MTPQQVLAADSVRRVLDAVLSNPEFETRTQSQVSTVLGRALAWIWSLLSKAVRWLFRGADFTAPGWHLARWVATLVIASVGVWLLVRLTRMALQAVRHGGGRGDASGGPGGGRDRTAAEWEALARQASSDQRWREASMALYHAVVLRMAETGRLRVSASKTPGDYRREVAGRAVPDDLYTAVAAFLRSFERVAFARRLPVADDYRRLSDLAASLGAHG